MKQRRMGARLWSSLFGCLLLSLCLVPTAWAQQTLGTVSVTVVDTSGAAVPGATLTLTDLATNDARTGSHPRGGQLHLREPQFRPAQTDRVPPRLRDAELRRAGAVRSHHGCEGHVEGRRRGRSRRGVGRGGAAGGDLDQRDQHDHRHETDRRSAPGRPQHQRNCRG